jgi:hypothetical protein
VIGSCVLLFFDATRTGVTIGCRPRSTSTWKRRGGLGGFQTPSSGAAIVAILTPASSPNPAAYATWGSVALSVQK